MNEESTPGQDSARSLQAQTPCLSLSRSQFKTPRRPKTPLSRRLIASTRAAQEGAEEGEEHDYSGLLRKTWKTYSLSPLYKFKNIKTAFTKYARSLDLALSQEKFCGLNPEESESGHQRSSFSLYEGLNFNDRDPQSVQIQVTLKTESERGARVVLNAFLICVDLDDSPVAGHLSSHFTYYPVILISGSKARTETLLNWFEQHFDCHSAPVRFSNNDLRWMLASWSWQDVSNKSLEVLMQYSLEGACEGISTVDCKFESAFCKLLWERLNGDVSAQQTVTDMQVEQFVDSLEKHLEYTMHIIFSKLSLSEVGTSVAYVSSAGKFKLFSTCGVFPALHLICEIVKDRYLDMGYPVA